MRKLILFFWVPLLILGCKQVDNAPVAKVFHYTLYKSEVLENTPFFTSKEDSLAFMEKYVDEWITRKTLLTYANKNLTQKEQNFSAQMEQYKEQLLINAYLQKMSKDSALFAVTKKELSDFFGDIPSSEPEYKDMVKLNYIKFSNSSKLYKKIKDLFFDETDKVNAIKKLETLCADTIEYYLDSEHWFYTDFIENELPFLAKVNIDQKEKFEYVQDEYKYLVIILDKKKQLQPKITLEDRKIAQSLLQQQKKATFFKHYQDSLVQKTLLEKKATRFGFSNH